MKCPECGGAELVPGVKEARALSAMLQTHPVFQHFKGVNVSGVRRGRFVG